MCEAKYNESFGGWLAFRHGKVLVTRDRRIKVFSTKEAAEKAAQSSRVQFGAR